MTKTPRGHSQSRLQLFAIVSAEVYRFGRSNPQEKRAMRRLIQFLKLTYEEANSIAIEAKRNGLANPDKRDFDKAGVYKKVIKTFCCDKRADQLELQMICGIRQLFSISDEIHMRVTQSLGLNGAAFPSLALARTVVQQPTNESVKPLPGADTGVLANNFEVGKLIGQGGMGQVYRGLDRSLERDVAIKMISPHLAGDENFIERFKREARLAAKIQHANLVSVYFLGTEATHGCPYVVLEYVDGQSLQDLLAKEKSLSPERTVDILLDVAKGLRAALEEGIIHRDVKPSNIMLTRDGQAKVTDFGLAASLASSTFSREGSCIHKVDKSHLVGTAHFMAPERILGKECDHRSDMYSLGISAFEMLTGKKPYDAWNFEGVLALHLRGDLPSITELQPIVPSRLSKIVEQMLSLEPAERYETYTELIEALETSLEEEDTPAPVEKEVVEQAPFAPSWAARFGSVAATFTRGREPSSEEKETLQLYVKEMGLQPLAKLIGPLEDTPHYLLVAQNTVPVGRHERNVVILNDSTCVTGRSQGRLLLDEEKGWSIERHNGSPSNVAPISVNGAQLQVQEKIVLEDGDSLSFSDTVSLGVRKPIDDIETIELYVEELPEADEEYRNCLRWTLMGNQAKIGGSPDCHTYLPEFEYPLFNIYYKDGLFWLDEPVNRQSMVLHVGWNPIKDRCPLFYRETIHIGGYEYLFYQLRSPEELWMWDDELDQRDLPR